MTSHRTPGGARALALQDYRSAAALIVVSAIGLVSIGCGEVARTGKAPAMLIIERLDAASGAEPGESGTILQSDVQTLVDVTIGGQTVRVPTVFNDIGTVTFRLALKNPGSPAAPLGPSTLNEITVTRYRVVYRRSDGRAVQGTDVPYSFDGAFTVTVPSNGTAGAAFDLVRHQAKQEPPLRNLIGGNSAQFISTIAEVTFYGRDLAGNEVMAVGTIGVNFADYGDPD
jgi:hypothetical protein